MINSPFKFLDTYTREDRDIFFGRDREIDELYYRVFESNIILVYGLSGTGKSSLIQCGLANKFQEADWFSLNIRRGKNIIESVHKAIQAAAHTHVRDHSLTPDSFLKSVRSLFLDYYKPVYFIFDQFEELFIFGNSSEKQSFIEIIKVLAASEVQCRFIFVLREEYLASVTEFEDTIPNFLANRVRIEKMTPASAKMAIEGPCQVFDIPVESGFADALLERLSGSDSEIELTYLQVFLDKIYRKATKECYGKPFTFKTSFLEDTRNVSDVLGSFLDEQIELFPKPDDALVVLKSFISVKGTRLQMTLEEVKNFSTTLGKPISDGSVKEIFQKLIQLRILRDKDQNNRFELRHDALAAVIYKKISVVERDILEIRHFLENAYVIYEKRGKLLAREDLKYIAPYEDKLFLGQNINEFIAKSKKEIFRSSQRLRNYKIVGVLFTIIVLSGFTIWALSEKNKANRLYIKSKAITYNYLSKEVVEYDPNSALRLAEYALELDPENTDIQSNIRNIYYNNSFFLTRKPCREGDQIKAMADDGKKLLIARGNILILIDDEGNELQRFEGHSNEIISAAFSPDGKTVLSGSYDRTARLWDFHGNTLQIMRGHSGEVGHVIFSSDGQTLLTSSWDRSSHLWNISGRQLRSFPGLYLTAIAPDGSILAGASGRAPYICDMVGRIIRVFEGHDDLITSVSFSPDGKMLLSGSQDKTARLWDLDGNMLRIFSGHPESVSITAFSPEGNLVFTGSNGMLRVWHISGLIQRNFKIEHEINHLVFRNNADQILATTVDGYLLFLNNSGNLQAKLSGPGQTIRFLDFSSDGKYLMAGSIHAVNIWDNQGRHINAFKSQANGRITQILSGSFLQDGRLVLLYDDNRIRFWDIYGTLIQQWETLPATLVCASPDARYILINSHDNTLRLYDFYGAHVRTFSGHSGNVISMAFSGDGNKIITGSIDQSARLWNIDGEIIAIFKGHHGPVTSVAMSKDNQVVYTGSAHRTETFAVLRGAPRLLGYFTSDDNSIRSWDIYGNQLYINRILHPNIRSLDLDVQSDFYMAGFENNTAKLIGLDGQEFQTLRGKNGHITAVAISPDRKVLAAADQDIFLWDAMISYGDFKARDDYDKLSISDKLKYNIIDLKTALSLKDENDLYEAAEFYFEKASRLQQDKRLRYLDYSLQLFDKLNSRFNNAIYKLRMIEIHHLLDHINPSGKFESSTRKYTKKLMELDDPQLLLKSARFLNTLAQQTNNSLQKERLLANSALFYDKFIINYPLIDIKDDAAQNYQLLIRAYIKTGKYDESLKSAEDGLRIMDDLSMQAYLTVCYFFMLDYDAAKQVIRNNDFDLVQGVRFRQTLRSVFEILEQDGVIHPDRNAIMAIMGLNLE